MSLLAHSDSLEYICYGSTITINIFTFTVRGSTPAAIIYYNMCNTVDLVMFAMFYFSRISRGGHLFFWWAQKLKK